MLSAFCGACADTIERPAETAGASVAAFVYAGAVSRAIVRFKYERRPDLARPLGDLLWRSLAPRASALDGVVVIPVPLHPSRLAERGFNQSALVAARVARHLDAPLLPLALQRLRATKPQAALDRAARIANCAGAFRARRPETLRGRPALLVDDVRTTGATLAACAMALLEAGASRVHDAVIAQAEQQV